MLFIFHNYKVKQFYVLCFGALFGIAFTFSSASPEVIPEKAPPYWFWLKAILEA